MYTVCEIPRAPQSDARGLDLREAFTRIMALMERQYMFTRTGRVMHLLMTPQSPDDPPFESGFTVDARARNAIMAQVCAHGLGRFRVITDEQHQWEEEKRDEQAA
jgi:hypothetical protein